MRHMERNEWRRESLPGPGSALKFGVGGCSAPVVVAGAKRIDSRRPLGRPSARLAELELIVPGAPIAEGQVLPHGYARGESVQNVLATRFSNRGIAADLEVGRTIRVSDLDCFDAAKRCIAPSPPPHMPTDVYRSYGGLHEPSGSTHHQTPAGIAVETHRVVNTLPPLNGSGLGLCAKNGPSGAAIRAPTVVIFAVHQEIAIIVPAVRANTLRQTSHIRAAVGVFAVREAVSILVAVTTTLLRYGDRVTIWVRPVRSAVSVLVPRSCTVLQRPPTTCGCAGTIRIPTTEQAVAI